MDAIAKSPRRVLILGAAGRDFHDFNLVFRDDPRCRVVAFTAAQIPDIAGRRYPPELAGSLYPTGIPIIEEADGLARLRELGVNEVVFAYSDLRHEDVMHKASQAVAAGADFRLLGAEPTMLSSAKPVLSICAVRTGCGKSALSRWAAGVLRKRGLRVAVIRHPMPYGDLRRQIAQRFASLDDLRDAECTIEEREEYEPHIAAGDLVFAGVDYERVLRAAEAEADVILWDGGNNDLPFIKPDLEIVLADPHRAGDEIAYFPGEANLLRAQVVVLAKADTADPLAVEKVRRDVQALNPAAEIVEAAMPISLDRPELVAGKRVLVVEDGPTCTHGGMAYGAGVIAAKAHGAAQIVDPRPFAAGSIRGVFEQYATAGPLLPAMGYNPEQLRDLEATIRATPCDAVIIATPVDLSRLITISQPTCRVTYEVQECGGDRLEQFLNRFVEKTS